MQDIGLVEVECGRWVSLDGLKELADFDGGMVMITRMHKDHPEYDIRTVHVGQQRDVGWLNECLKVHIEEIKRRTEELRNHGALKPPPALD